MTCTVDETALRTRTGRQTMRAEDIAEDFPIVPIDSDAVAAARMLAEHSLPGLLVIDASGKPYAVLPAFEICGLSCRATFQDDWIWPASWANPAPTRPRRTWRARRSANVLPDYLRNVPSANARDGVMKVAAAMAKLRSPLIAVTKDGRFHGAITASCLLAAVLKS